MPSAINTSAKFLGTALLVGLVSACSVTPSPLQFAESQAVHEFDESRATFGQRIALADAGFTTKLRGLNPYFGR